MLDLLLAGVAAAQPLRTPPKRDSRRAARLTVAARALHKHADRGTERFWGSAAGPEAAKNAHARAVLERVLAEAVWLNAHCTGGLAEPLFEARVPEGYGARWALTADGARFRGFLEPPMEDGHAKRWRH